MFPTALWSDTLEHLVNQVDIQCDQIWVFLPVRLDALRQQPLALYNSNV